MRIYKMENNYEILRMPELKALTRERRLRGYSWFRKADLIAFLQNNEHSGVKHRRSSGQETTETSTDVYLGTAEGTTN